MNEALRQRITELEAIVAAQAAEIAQLKQLIAKLLEEKGRNSKNSGKPPSSDTPATRAQRRAKGNKGERKPGGQHGHEGSSRALVPPERVNHVEDLFPPECENCFASLPKTPDSNPRRYQTAELPQPLTRLSRWVERVAQPIEEVDAELAAQPWRRCP